MEDLQETLFVPFFFSFFSDSAKKTWFEKTLHRRGRRELPLGPQSGNRFD